MLGPVTSRQSIGNFLLDALPDDELGRFNSYFEHIELSIGKELHAAGEPIRYVYFPHDAVVSLISGTESGATGETALVSNGGIVGLPVFLGKNTHTNRAVVLVAGSATRVKAQPFQEELCQSRLLRTLLHHHTNFRLIEASCIAVCAQSHSVLKRFARWLLLLQDRSRKDEFELTHESLGQMLGVRREGITAAAIQLQQLELIHYRRGHIQIVDRPGLEAIACECYETIRSEFNQLQVVSLAERAAIAMASSSKLPSET